MLRWFTPKALLYVSLCLLGRATVAFAQTSVNALNPYTKVSIASPTAASLGKFVDIPVNYHTGIPQISVPLYTIQEGSLSLPLSLSYHAGGIKVQEPAGWVGTGWALNAGGVITRTIVGAPDEVGTSIAIKGHFSDYGYSNYLMTGAVVGNGSTMRPGPNDPAIANALYDGEPDLFFFNFNGYSGKFYFSDDRTPVIVDGQDLKIEYYYPHSGGGISADNNIQGFIITVPTGDKYYFGSTDSQPYGAGGHDGDKPVEMTYTYYGDSPGVDNNVYSSYYLSKIVAADGVHAIQFTYQRETYSFHTLLTNPVPNVKIIDPHLTGIDLVLANLDPVSVSLARENIDGVRLAKISFSTGAVTFIAATTPRTDLSTYWGGGFDEVNKEAKALASIQVKGTGTPSFCKQFDFTYSYFSGDNTQKAAGLRTPDGSDITTDKTRLKLESVQEKSCDGTVVAPAWKFTYNGTFLPRRLSYAQDHWGFYNGADANNGLNTLIPTYSFGTADVITPGSEVAGANRDPAWPAMALGILTKVTYPTGGTATYEYEPNDVYTKRQKYDYQEVASACVGSYCGAQSPVQLTIPFSGNFYKFTLDYTHNPNDSYNGSAQFSGVGIPIGLSVGENPSVYRLHDENVQRPAKGTITCQLYGDIGVGSGEGAIVRVSEYLLQTTESNAYAGGLRIKTTTAQENAQAAGLVTSYTYQEATGHSSGTLFTRPRYVQVVRNDLLGELGFSADGSTAAYNLTPHGCLGPETANNQQIYLKSPCSILPLATTQGNHIGYSRVTVKQQGNGRTEYRYYCSNDQTLDTGQDLGKMYNDVCYRTINPGVCDPAIPNLPAPPARFEFNRGQLAAETNYNEQNQLVKQAQYTYQYDSSRIVTPGYLSKYVAGALLGGTYERRGYWKKQTSVEQTLYSSTGQPFTTKQVVYYESPYHHQPTRQVETTPAGDVLETRHQYALDLNVPACNNLDDGTASYTQACRTCDATYATDYSACGTMGCKFDAYIAHVVCRVNARNTYVTYRRANFTDPTNTYQTAHNQAKTSADSQLKPLLLLQDAYHNEEVETSNWRNTRLLSASYTRFGPGLTQPTVMYPAQQFGLFLAAPATTFTATAVKGNSVSRDVRYPSTPDLTLSFDQGALVQVLSRTAPVTSYVWGYNSTLPLVKATGVRYSTLSAAYRAASGDLGALRQNRSVGQALLTTYAYQPLVGMTSQTDPTGRATSFEYDVLGRLVRTRDEQKRILSQQQYHYVGK